MRTRKSSAQRASQRPLVREKNTKRKQAVENNDDQHEAERRFEHFVDAPGAVAKNREADDHGDGRGDQLRAESPSRARPRSRVTPRCGSTNLLEGVDVVLKVARKKFPDLLIKTVDVGDQRQQAKQQRESDAGADHLLSASSAPGKPLRLSPIALSISPSRQAGIARATVFRGEPSVHCRTRDRSRAGAGRRATPESSLPRPAQWPSVRAFWDAISAETAISPAKLFAAAVSTGNESTSVGLFFRGNAGSEIASQRLTSATRRLCPSVRRHAGRAP